MKVRMSDKLGAMVHATTIARLVDFRSDMATWPDDMIQAYLDGNAVEDDCRAHLARSIVRDLTDAAEAS